MASKYGHDFEDDNNKMENSDTEKNQSTNRMMKYIFTTIGRYLPSIPFHSLKPANGRYLEGVGH